MFIKYMVFLIGLAIIFFIILAVIKAWKKADVEQKLEDIDTTAELAERIKDVDVEKFTEQKKAVEKFKNI